MISKVYTIYIKPISINKSYRFKNKKMYMTNEAKEYKNKIYEKIKNEKKFQEK